MAEIVLIRHGQTEWSAAGKHTSYTDLELTPVGERQARALAEALAARTFAAVLSSPRRRPASPYEAEHVLHSSTALSDISDEAWGLHSS